MKLKFPFFDNDLTTLKLPTVFRNSGVSTLAAPSADLIQALLAFPSSAGKPVTRATAIRVAAVLASVKTMANDIAKMPLILRETKTVNGLQRTTAAVTNPLYSILKDVPNRFQTSFQLRWYLAAQLIMTGNCFCQKITDQAGDIIELVPLNAWAMSVKWDSDAPVPKYTQIDAATGRKIPVLCWHYMDGNSILRKFYQQDLWHATAHNIEGNGFEGAALIALGKEAIGVLIAAEETAGRNFANGLGMGGFITFPKDVEVTEEQAQNTVDRLKKDFSGSQNAGKFTALPLGATFEKMTFNAQESQLLESRKWNEEEVARLFGGAPLIVKLGLSDQNSTYASSSAFLDEYFNTTILPYTTVLEQTITRDLIPKAQWGTLYVKHNADVILRGSPEDRAKTNQIRIQSFQMTPNEARAVEDMDAIEGGDFLSGGTGTPVIFDIENQRYFIPGQLQPMMTDDEQEQKKANAPVIPAPAPVQPEPDSEGSGASSSPDAQTKTRLQAMTTAAVERIMRKEAKTGPDARFVADVLCVTTERAESYATRRNDGMTEDEARQALFALAEGK